MIDNIVRRKVALTSIYNYFRWHIKQSTNFFSLYIYIDIYAS